LTSTALQEIIVVKLGGSILEDEKAISKAAGLVKATHERGIGVAVVVSAMKGVTDQLLALSRKINPEIAPSMLDDVLALGEKTSARLVAVALAAYGLRPVLIDPESPEWPIITDEKHLDANPLMEESRKRTRELILPLMQEGKIPVVTGFLGRTVSGKTTTLGRGGSDTTAVVLGNCLGAKEVVLIKDVDGVFSSDPDKVTNPQLLDTLEGGEAELLAAGGAKFLHVKALRYQTKDTRIRVTSMDRLEAGTVIHGGFPEINVEINPQGVTMITMVGFATSKIESVTKVAEALRRAGGMLLALSMESSSALFYISGGENLLDVVHQVLVNENLGKAVSSFDGLSMITIRGRALETESGLIQRVTQPLARASINLYGIVTITSSIRVFVSKNQAEKAVELIKAAMLVD
jgi:aspartate kinase